VADLTINPPRNPYTALQSPDALSTPDASAQWSAVVADQRAARHGAASNQTGTSRDGSQSDLTATAGQTGDQKPAAGSSWSPWIHGGLTAGSFLPSFVGAGFSAADGVVYSIEGDRKNAAFSFGAAAVGLLTDAGVAKAAALGLGVASKALKVADHAAPAILGVEKIAQGSRVLRSSNELAGVERASQSLLDAVGKRRVITWAAPGSDVERYLNMRNAEAASFGTQDILLRPNPSKAAVLEEFLHGTQQRLGIVDKLGSHGLGSAETHVKDFMIRHQWLLGLGAEDARRLQILKDAGL
jgi:hypothetical protein